MSELPPRPRKRTAPGMGEPAKDEVELVRLKQRELRRLWVRDERSSSSMVDMSLDAAAESSSFQSRRFASTWLSTLRSEGRSSLSACRTRRSEGAIARRHLIGPYIRVNP